MTPQFFNTAYGITNALQNVFPAPVIANRAPATTDTGYQLGTIWVYKATNAAWVLTSVASAAANWESITGASGSFTSLTVSPGPISLTGTTTINTTGAATTSIGSTSGASGIALLVGSGNYSLDGAAGSTITEGASLTTGTITIGGTAQQGAMTLGSSSATNIVNLGIGAGATTVNIATGVTNAKTINVGTGAAMANTITIGGTGANVITIGSTTASAATTIQAGSGTTGLSLSAGGNVQMAPATNSAAGVSLTLNARVGQATFTGQTTASGASQAFAITNSAITGTTQSVFVSADNLGSNDAQMSITRVLLAASTITVTLKNNGAASLNGDVHINFWVLN